MDEKKKRHTIKPGDELGNAVFLERKTINAEAVTHGWLCRCKLCGSEFFSYTAQYNVAMDGCPQCRKLVYNERIKQDMIARWSEHIGERHGELVINGIHLERYKEHNIAVAECHCDCGKDTNIPIVRILQGIATTCGHNTDKNLGIGHKMVKEAAVDGTCVLAIMPDRQVNKNSTTGHKGISQMKNGYYRAYINFRRKQYYLGTYKDIDKAIEARKAAEKEIYGSFLDWYARVHPEQWEKIQKSKQ
ncbi:MAG: AP2 domain-containing protein [Lachnospiraceae bacterium]|nr:AP2 domain-containing protein [Lachnospiraceae bacterium]